MAGGGRDTNNFLKLVEAPGAVENYLLFAFEGEEALSELFNYRLTARSQGEIPDASAWIGASITFTLGESDDALRRLNGRCVHFQHSYQKGNYVEFRLELAPSLSTAQVKRDHRIFRDKSPKQVISTVLAEHQVSFDDSKVNGPVPADYIVQADETDFDFISRLMESEGIFYYFKYDQGGGRYKHKMHLADDPSGFYDGEPFEVSFRRDHLLLGLKNIEMAHAPAPGAVVTHDYDYKHPGDLTPVTSRARLNWSDKPAQVYEWSPGYADPGQGRRRAQLAMERRETEAVALRGQGSYATFAPGARFHVDDTRLKPSERRITVRSVHHDAFDPWGLGEGQPHYAQDFTAHPSAQAFRPPRRAPEARSLGPQTGVVVDQNDPEGFGRVKVRFHWDRTGDSTAWVRVLQQWAGAQIGAQFVPRPGMEVMIDFLNGDPAAPVVVGCLFNGRNKHAYEVPAKLSQAGWRTQSHPHGAVVNEFLFEDKAGGEEIWMSAGRDYRRRVAKDETATVGENKALQVGKTMHVHAKQEIVVASDTRILLQVGKSTVEITAQGVSIDGALIKLNS